MRNEELLYDHYKETGQILSRCIVKRMWLFVFLCLLILLISILDLSIVLKKALINNYFGEIDGNSVNNIIDSRNILTIILHITFAGLYLYFCSINILCGKYSVYLEELEKDLSVAGNYILDREGCSRNRVYNQYMNHIQSAFVMLFIMSTSLFFAYKIFYICSLNGKIPNMGYIELFLSVVIISISAFILFIMYKSPRFQPDDLQKITGVPVVGNIPFFDEKHININDIAVSTNAKKSGTYLSINQIFQNFVDRIDKLYNKKKRDKGIVILITSCKILGGKTFVARNLAYYMYELLQKKVLVCDVNFQSKRFWFDNAPHVTFGFLDCLRGQVTDMEQVISNQGVHYLSAGNFAPSEDWLESRERLNTFFEELKNRYEYVILDSPALFVQNPMLLRDIADVTLLVCSQKTISSNDIRRMRSYKREGMFKNLGIVLNGTNLKYNPFVHYANKAHSR